jgi:hypothetical protein
VKIKDITEGFFSTLAKDFVGDTNLQAAELQRRRRQEKQQAASTPQVDYDKLNPTLRTNPARTAPAPTPTTPEKVELTPGVTVVKAVDPIILAYQGKNFTRHPNGNWTKLGQTKAVDLNTKQFLDSELAKL